MKMLNAEDENRLRENFLKQLGMTIRAKREKKNISQGVLAECLHVTDATISRYERGERDMNVSTLPLISTYCGFPMSEYFTVEMSKELLENFAGLVEITRKKYQREHRRRTCKGRVHKKLKGHVYEIDGQEEVVYVPEKILVPERMSERELLLRGDVVFEQVESFSGDEFANYLQTTELREVLPVLDAAGKIIRYIGDASKKETFKTTLSDFVIDNLIIEPVLRDKSETAKRAYMYYKEMLDMRGDEYGGPLRP